MNKLTSYNGTKDPISMHVMHKNRSTKKWDSRCFYQVNMCFGGNFKLSARANATLCRKEANAVAKYLQTHGDEIVKAALAYKK